MSNKLHTTHLEQLISYLEFEAKNRKNILSDVKDEIEDHIQSRVDQSESYSGSELMDALEDTPDVLSTLLDHALEHQRDITTVLIQHVFKQFQSEGSEISIGVEKLENELDVKQAHILSENLTAKPVDVIKKAPLPPEKAKKVMINEVSLSQKSPNEEAEKLRKENEQMKQSINDQLESFMQYQKLLEMIRQREIEVNGLRARL